MTVTIAETSTDPLEAARHEFRTSLIEAELLVPMGVDGLYGRGGTYEAVIDGIEALLSRVAFAEHGNRAKVLRFPPVYSREVFEACDYVASFPHLTGAISTFEGDGKGHHALLADRAAGLPWDGHLSSAGTMLVPAACHPSFATLPPEIPSSGQLMDVYGYCFRHEPATDPARMQAFRQHEYVLVGSPEQTEQHRDTWLSRAASVLDELGLEPAIDAANDQFFGRAGKMLALNQRTESLKTELSVRLYGDLDDGTALISVNSHRDHFGSIFDISTPDGECAHSACVGFGVDRIALALFRHHGLDPSSWSRTIQGTMGW